VTHVNGQPHDRIRILPSELQSVLPEEPEQPLADRPASLVHGCHRTKAVRILGLSVSGIGLFLLVAAAFAAVIGTGIVVWFGLRGGPSAESAAIERMLREDRRIGQETIGALSPSSSRSQVVQAIRTYCARAAAQEQRSAPADFLVSYRVHLQAWKETADRMAMLPDNVVDGFFVGLFNSLLRNEPDGGIARLENRMQEAADRVRSTWNETERIGAKYGVFLP
jgi:hypothetical protein